MAKRFTDTDKWKRNWFSDLSPTLKLVWIYVLDECDASGVWCINFRRLKFDTGASLSREEFESAFHEKIVPFTADKYFIPSFIEFQYGQLREDSRPHASVIKQLKKHGLYEGYLKGIDTVSIGYQNCLEGYPKSTDTLKEQEQEQEQEQVKEQVKEKGESEGGIKIHAPQPSDLVAVWRELKGPLPDIEKLTDARKDKARAQLAKYPDLDHWREVLDHWRKSQFVTGQWRPTFDDLLSETKRVATLEGRYDERKRAATGATGPPPIRYGDANKTQEMLAEQGRRAEEARHTDPALVKELLSKAFRPPHPGGV
jgi:hypothetical protein